MMMYVPCSDVANSERSQEKFLEVALFRISAASS